MHASTIGDDTSRLLLSQRVIEPCKWLGLVLMVAEHASWYVWHVMPAPVFMLGRMVFPLFGLALALGCVGKTRAELLGVVGRLAGWGVVAAAAGLLVRDPMPLNVLFTFALGIMLYSVLSSVNRGRRVVALLLVLAGFAVEFSVWGVIAVASLMLWARDQSRWGYLALAFGCFCAANGNVFAAFALPVAYAVELGQLELPRVRRLFYWTYAGQWPVFAVARVLV